MHRVQETSAESAGTSMGTRESTSDEVDAQANALQSTGQRRWSALCLDLSLNPSFKSYAGFGRTPVDSGT